SRRLCSTRSWAPTAGPRKGLADSPHTTNPRHRNHLQGDPGAGFAVRGTGRGAPGPGESGAVAADRETVARLVRHHGAVLHQEAGAARELVVLSRDDGDLQLLTGQVGAGELVGLHDLAVVIVGDALVFAGGLQALERIGGDVLVFAS